MKLFTDPQFWVSVSFLICMGVLAKVMFRRFVSYVDQHIHHRQEVLQTLREEEKASAALLKQEQQRALVVAEERKVIKQNLKTEISSLGSAMQDHIKRDIKIFEKHYAKLQESMIEEFEHTLQTKLVHNIIEGTREILRQPAMQKHQHKIVARHLKTLQ